MPKFTHAGYGIDWDSGAYNHGMALRFEKAMKDREIAAGEVKRAYWGRLVEAGAEAGVIPPLEKPVEELEPGLVLWLAGQIAGAHNQATAVLPE